MTLFVEQPLVKAVGLLIIMYNPPIPSIVEQYWMHSGLAHQLTPKKNSKWGRWHFNLVAEMLNFSIMTSCRLMTISLRRILGGAWGVLGWILDIKGGTERNYMLSLSEVQWSFWQLEVFPELLAPSSSTFTNYMFSEVTLGLLQRSSEKLPLDGRYICESTLINMMTSTLMPF